MPRVEGSQASIYHEQFGSGPDVVFIAGGGDIGARWHRYQIPYFSRRWRCTTFDNRGVGRSQCGMPLPWTAHDFATDAADLIRGVCDPPVALVGLSVGAIVAQQVAIDHPDLVRCAVVLGTGASSEGWCWDYQQAEIDFRRAGGRLDGMMGVIHYASMLYPARALGDPRLWSAIKQDLTEWMDSGDNEESLQPHWDMSLRFDQTKELPGCRVPIHVVAGQEDVQAPPQDARVVADLAQDAEYHPIEGMGHCSIYGHMHDALNPFIESLLLRHA